MTTIEDLQKEFDEKVKKLQETCEHKETYWAELWWTIAHSTVTAVKICKTCGKHLEEITLNEAYEKGYLKSLKQRY